MVEDPGMWDLFKSLLQWLLLPLIAALGYFFKTANRRIHKLEDDMISSKTRIAVIESKIDDIREDIKDIKRGVDKLVERK